MNIQQQSQPQPAQTSEHVPRFERGHASAMASRSASFDRRTRADVDSWVEVSSQPSSSSLSSVADEIVTTGLRVQDDPRNRRRRTGRPGAPTHLNITRTQSAGGTSSQEEYEESESESDRIMTSSGEGPIMAARYPKLGDIVGQEVRPSMVGGNTAQISDDDDENRTAINDPINHGEAFTPLPNAFSHPPSGRVRNTSQPAPGSYFPSSRPGMASRPSTRQSLPMTSRQSHAPQNPLSPSFNAAAEHEAALRASLSGLLSVAAAARGLQKPEAKRPQTATVPARSNWMDPSSFRLVPESALTRGTPAQPQEPTFKPTIRRTSTNSTSTTSEQQHHDHKRKAAVGPARNTSRERKLKKARRSATTEDLLVTPTLLTWVVSAGVVVFLSALSFSAGYSLGKEAGRLEAGSLAADESLRSCAREAGRTSLGLKRSLARSAIQV